MRADCIYDIIKKFGCFSYDCILFDGPWGIGKTYAIDKALEEQENVCSISMFGLQNSQQIYHEVLCQFVLKNNKAGKIAGAATEVLDGISNIWKSVSSVKEVLQSIAREKAEQRATLLEINKLAAQYFYYQLRTEKGQQGYQYLAGRGLSEETMRKFGLGYSDKFSD